MKTRILVGIAISSLLLASCGKVPQTEIPRPDATQNHVTGTTSTVTGANSDSQIPDSSRKIGVNGDTQEPVQLPVNTKSADDTCLEIAKAMGNSESPDFALLKSCSLRAAAESGSFKYCLDHYENFSDSIERTQEGVNDCARTVIIRAIEWGVKKNGQEYPQKFCENAFSAIKSGGDRSMDTSIYRDGLDTSIINECITEYAALSGNPRICTNDGIWGEPVYSGGGSGNRKGAIERQIWQQNECIWGVHLRNSKTLTSSSACSMFQKTSWGIADADGPCGFAERPNATAALRKIAEYEKIPSIADLEKKLSEMTDKNAEKVRANQKMDDFFR